MPDLIADAARWLATKRASVMATAVLWRRGSESASVTATVGRATFTTESASGRIEQIESRTFTINIDQLRSAPRERDEIVETINGAQVVNTVIAPGGMAAVVWADDARTAWKVFTKVIG